MKLESVVVAAVLACCAPAAHAQCSYRESLVPLESIEGLTAEQIEGGRILRDAFAAAFERQDERIEALSREENQRIRAVVDGNIDDIFFMYVFGSYMPVPNRYVARSPGIFQAWTSGNPASAASSQRPEDALGLMGTIRFGPRSELPQFVEEDPEPCERAAFIRHGLNVEIRDYRSFRWVTLYDDSEYLSIIDSNASLWEAMLDVWHELDDRRDE